MEEKTAGEGMHQIIIDGNAFYEIDEDCVKLKEGESSCGAAADRKRGTGKKGYGTTD